MDERFESDSIDFLQRSRSRFKNIRNGTYRMHVRINILNFLIQISEAITSDGFQRFKVK